MNRLREAPDRCVELRSLESEILEVRRYILEHHSSTDSEKLWMQLVWSDLLLDQWSTVNQKTRQVPSSGRKTKSVTAPRRGRPVRAFPNAAEPLTLAGLGACLEGAPGVVVVRDFVDTTPRIDVCVHAIEQVDADSLYLLEASMQRFDAPAVLVANRIGRGDLDILSFFGVHAVLPRVAASSGRLVDTIRAVGSDRPVPGPDLLAGLWERA